MAWIIKLLQIYVLSLLLLFASLKSHAQPKNFKKSSLESTSESTYAHQGTTFAHQGTTFVKQQLSWFKSLVKFNKAAKNLLTDQGLKVINLVQIGEGLNLIGKLTDPKKSWNLNELSKLGLKAVNLGTWVTGYTIPGLWTINLGYGIYSTPPVRSFFDESIYGTYLLGPQESYSEDEFTNPQHVSQPYLVCNFYDSVEDIKKGYAPKYWDYISKDIIPPEYLNEQEFYNNHMILNGRWIRQITDTWTFIIRFATSQNFLQIFNNCINLLKHQKIISSEEDLQKIVPHVAYSNYTASYPIFFYIPIKVENDQKTETRFFLATGEKKSDIEYGPDIPDAKNIPMGDDVKDVLGDLLGTIGTVSTLYYAADMAHRSAQWTTLFSFKSFYDGYHGLVKAWNKGEMVSLETIERIIDIGAGLETLTDPSFGQKDNEGKDEHPEYKENIKNLHLAAANIYGFKSLTAIKNYIIPQQGTSLDGPQESYDLTEFKDESKLGSTYLICYYNNQNSLDEGKPLYWNWALSTDTSNHFQLKGRWIRQKEGSYIFATLEDPAKLLNACLVGLMTKNYVDKETAKNFELDKTQLMVGTSRITSAYPIAYYIPARVMDVTTEHTEEEGSDIEKVEKAILYAPK